MISIAISSTKGGVGKTTVALNTAYALARRGWRTLLVDVDPQGAIGYSLSRKAISVPGLYEVVRGQMTLEKALIRTRLSELAILPVGQIPDILSQQLGEYVSDGIALKKLITEATPNFDIVILDTAAGFASETLGALRAADRVLIPVQAEPLSARTLQRSFRMLGALRAEGSAPELLGVVITMLQKEQKSSRQVAEEIQRSFPPHLFLKPLIPKEAIFLEASAAGVPLGLMSRRPPAAAEYFNQLAIQLEQRLALQEEDSDEPISLLV